MKLTQRIVDTLTCEAGRKDRLVFDDVQKGLAVRVTATGGRTFVAQYTLAGQKRRVPLGSCGAVSLADAREAVQAIMGDVAKAIDPAAERKARAVAGRAAAERERLTLEVLVDTWARLHLARKRPKYAKEAVRALRHAFARQWTLPAEDLTRSIVVREIDRLVRAKRAAMAARTAAYGRACFAWAMKRGTLAVNPFAALPMQAAGPKRDRVLADDELATVWRASATVGEPFGTIVRLLILTGQRREEVSGIEHREVSADWQSWTIAGPRTKNGVAHVVPLSRPARDIVKALAEQRETDEDDGEPNPLLLPGAVGKPFNGFSKAKSRLDDGAAVLRARSAGVVDIGAAALSKHALPAWRLHDIRRTVATGLQRLGVRLEVTEAILNHVSGSRAGIVGVYQLHDWATEKRAALDAWAAHVMAVVEDRKPRPKVVRLAARR